MRFRTGYSFRTAYGPLSEVMDRVEKWNLGFAPITDRASTFGFARWKTLCEERGLKPVYGIELAVSKEPTAKKPVVDHWTFIAKEDLSEINRLFALATSDNQFRYEPILTYEQAISADAFKIVGHRSDLDQVVDTGIPSDLYVGLSPSISPGYYLKALENDFQFVACPDNKFPGPDDMGVYEVVCGRGASTQTYRQDILSPEEWRQSLNRRVDDGQKDRAMANALQIGESCADEPLRAATLLSPKHDKDLRQLCIEGADRLGIDLDDETYSERLDRELSLIYEKKFEDYFYIIEDLVGWARKNMVVGPARGSSCGSLVCYLLGITTIDPIPYGLLFERFIDLNRSDLPDIDIDFPDEQRDLVFDYMNDKYGADRVARLGTVSMYQAKSAMNEVGGAFSIPKFKIEGINRLLDHGESLAGVLENTDEGQKIVSEYPQIEIATKVLGQPRHHSQHAAGIVVTEEPVSKYVAVDSRTGSTNCDLRDAELLNLLKIDALGLIQLSVFSDALELLGLPHDYLETVPLDDQAAFDVLNEGNFSGVFQFNGTALQKLTQQTKISHIDDIIAITALARPGPLDSGGAQEWVDRKNGFNKETGFEVHIEYPHPKFEPYLKETRGVLVYQEQVMQIARGVGRFSWEDTSALRKAISKSKGLAAMRAFEEKFVDGCVRNGVSRETAEKFWGNIVTHGAYSFNKSHSVAYGIISYWCCWLKAHHPLEFAAAALTHQKDHERQIILLRELEAEGVGYIPVDAEISTNKWAIGKRGGKRVLVGPVQNVMGIGPKLVSQIMESRTRGSDLPSRAKKLLEKPITKIDTIWPITDRINEIMPDPAARNINSPITKIGNIGEAHETEETVLVIGVVEKISVKDINDPSLVERRGYRINNGPKEQMSLKIIDDTGEIWGKVNGNKFYNVALPIKERGGEGKAIYAFKCKLVNGLRFLFIDMARYIGEME